MAAAVTTGVIHLTDRTPDVSGADMVAALVPPPQFDGATFETYRADDAYPSQQAAKEKLIAFSGGGAAAPVRRGLFSKAPKIEPTKPGVYLDGGFGVGKTHLLASLWHAVPGPKAFGTFVEYTNLVGALTFRRTVDALKEYTLVCIDEFELDDPGDTMVMTRLLGELVPGGTRLAATSNTPPNALGEGRFAAQDFLREINAMSASFETLRIDGVDFRQRALDGHAVVLDDEAYTVAIADAAASGLVSDDAFGDLVAHLARVHPSRYIRLIDGLATIGLRDVVTLEDQSAALRLVAFVDRAYDAQVPIRATGVALDRVFGEDMLGGGYRKKYLRAISRLNALTHS